MVRIEPIPERPGGVILEIPDDLRLWLGEEQLFQLVLEAVDEPVGRSAAGFAAVARPVPLFLAVLTYAYLTARRGSEQIEEAMRSDPVLCELGRGRSMDASALRRFRRWARGPLSVAVFRALRTAVQIRRAGCQHNAPPVEDSEGLCRCAEHAERLLGEAVRADTLALDV